MPRLLSQTIKPFLSMEIAARAQAMEQAGERVIKLSLGQPDFDPPECVRLAAEKAMRDGHNGYTHSLGCLELREAIAAYYEEEYGLNISPERIAVTSGSSPAMLLLFFALLEQGDEVIVCNPRYACYESLIRAAGGSLREISVQEQDGFQLKPAAAQNALGPKTRAILLNSPSNPAGALVPRADLRAIAGLCAESSLERGPVLVSDEIYHGLAYDGRAASALEFLDNCCVLDGFSKRYAMTGWRLGWLVAPPSFIPAITALQQNFFICAGSVAQQAGLAALREAGPEARRMAAEYDCRRLLLLRLLREAGFGVQSSPAGAFYVLADARAFGSDSLALAWELLEKTKVAVAPGIDFGSGAEGYLRFSYAGSRENIEEALLRIKKYLATR